ncbi:histidinol dehydrogenase [Aquirufa sp. ROCK-SH2]
MLNQINYPTKNEYASICQRPKLDAKSLDDLIENIFNTVQSKKDQGLKELTLEFDKREINEICYSSNEIDRLATNISSELKLAIEVAYQNIYKFHEAQIFEEKRVETTAGVVCWQKSSPIEKVGIYIPGGTAPLFSTILMLAIPAKIAGCKEIVLCTPAQHPAIFFAAKLCGVTKICQVGGAQAIAALALGTESIPAVYKIFGPGNQYVTAAKMYANRKGIAIDMPAGPSEVAIYADESSVPAYIAADLLSQAEHGIDSQVFLVSNKMEIIEQTNKELELQLAQLNRKDFAKKSLLNSKAILVHNRSEAIELLNEYGAEHLILSCSDSEEFSDHIINAGSIFLGNYTPEAAGDYSSGTNHTLPTNGFAKAYSGVNLDSFIKKITLQSITKEGLQNLSSSIIEMAKAESLDAHANAVQIRLN